MKNETYFCEYQENTTSFVWKKQWENSSFHAEKKKREFPLTTTVERKREYEQELTVFPLPLNKTSPALLVFTKLCFTFDEICSITIQNDPLYHLFAKTDCLKLSSFA